MRTTGGGRRKMGLRPLTVRTAAAVAVAGFGVFVAMAGAGPNVLVQVNTVSDNALGSILRGPQEKPPYSEGKSASCAGPCATTRPPRVDGTGAKPLAGPGVTAS